MHISLISRMLGFVPGVLAFPDDGSGAGAGGGTGEGAGAGTGDGGTGDGGAAAAAIKLTDDSLVDFGDGKPVKLKDYRSGFVPKAEYETRMAAGKQILLSEAQKLEAAWQRYETGRGAKPSEPRPAADDLLESVGRMPVVDGATVAKLHRQGLGPVATLVAQQQAAIKALTDRLDRTERTTSQYTEEAANRSFDQAITEHIGALPEIKGIQGSMREYANEPAIRELAKDVWLSHDQNSWKSEDFRTMLAGRVEQMVALVRKIDRAAADRRKDEARQRFMNPNRGGGTATGDRGYVHKSGAELARDLFAARGADAGT